MTRKCLWNINQRARIRKYINEYKTARGCSRCPENRPPCLDFHHLDPSIKKYNVSFMYKKAYSLKTIIAEIEKCELICRNCHAMEHHCDRNENNSN